MLKTGFVFTCATVLSLSAVHAQVMQTMDAGGIFDLGEVGAVVVAGEKDLKVDAVMPIDERPKGYAQVDLRAGDLILFVNGKRAKTVQSLRECYDSVAIADTVKLGVQRGKEMFFVSFKKADPTTLPVRKMVIVGGERPGSGEGKRMQSFSFRGADEVRPLPELAVVVGQANQQVRILDELPLPGNNTKAVDLRAGDVLQSVNGSAISSFAQFFETFDKIPVGEMVTLKYLRGNTAMTATFAKPKSMANVIIKRQEQ